MVEEAIVWMQATLTPGQWGLAAAGAALLWIKRDLVLEKIRGLKPKTSTIVDVEILEGASDEEDFRAIRRIHNRGVRQKCPELLAAAESALQCFYHSGDTPMVITDESETT